MNFGARDPRPTENATPLYENHPGEGDGSSSVLCGRARGTRGEGHRENRPGGVDAPEARPFNGNIQIMAKTKCDALAL